MLALEFDMKHLKMAGHIGRNVMSITIKMRSIIRIFLVITILNLIQHKIWKCINFLYIIWRRIKGFFFFINVGF